MRKKLTLMAAPSSALLLATTLMLGGCSGTDTTPKPKTHKAVEVILPEEKFKFVVNDTKKLLSEADAKNNISLAGSRLVEPMRTYRAAQYELKKVAGDKYGLSAVVLNTKSIPVASGTEFPRSLVTFTLPEKKQNLSTLSIWSQDNPRAQYALWGQTRIFPGVKAPELISNLTDTPGFPKVDTEKYATDPAKVLAEYIAYNTSRKMGDVKFTKGDPLYTQVAEQQDALVKTVGDLGTVTTKFVAGKNGSRAVATKDGGLVITSEMLYSVNIKRKKSGAKLRLRGKVGTFFAKKDGAVLEVDKPVSAQYGVLVTFYVPPKNAKDKTVSVLGASLPTLITVKKDS